MKLITVKEAHDIKSPWILKFNRESKKFNCPGLYLVEFNCGVKVGISKNVQKSLEVYAAPWNAPIVQVAVYRSLNPRRLELKIMKYFGRFIGAGSYEFIKGTSFEQIVKFIESDRYFRP